MIEIIEVLRDANCSNHPCGIPEKVLVSVRTIYAARRCKCIWFNPDGNTCNSWCDTTESFGVGQLADGRFIAAMEASDTSGHGCRCIGSAQIYATLDEAIRFGLNAEMRESLPVEILERISS